MFINLKRAEGNVSAVLIATVVPVIAIVTDKKGVRKSHPTVLLYHNKNHFVNKNFSLSKKFCFLHKKQGFYFNNLSIEKGEKVCYT